MKEIAYMMELVSFEALDGWVLDGLYYTGKTRSTVVTLVVHGKSSNFYSLVSKFLPPAFVECGYDSLALNRRGHDVCYVVPQRAVGETTRPYGAAWEVYTETQQDIGGAVKFLRDRGYSRIVLIGHSFGGLAVAAYASSHHDISGVVLCSPVVGGPQMMKEGARRGQSAAEKYDELEEAAKKMLKEGKDDNLIIMPKWWFLISAKSLLKMESPFLLDCVKSIRCPLLAIRGGMEDLTFYPVDEIPNKTSADSKLVIIPETNHYYDGKRDVLAKTICEWLVKKAPLKP